MTFEEDLIQRLKNNVLNHVSKVDLIQPNYGHDRKPLPKEFLDKVWAEINWNEVIETVRPEIQKRICNAIVGNMETEIKTDIKSLLSVSGVREKLRIEVYPKLMKVLDGEI